MNVVGKAVLCVHIRTIRTETTIQFYPYCRKIALFVVLLSMYLIIIIVTIITTNLYIKMIMIMLILFMPYPLSISYALTQLEVTFSREGVRLSNCRAKNSWYAKWESFAGGYWIYTSNGRTSLLLVTHPMDKEEREEMRFVLNRIVRGKRVFSIEGNTFFPVDAVREEIITMIDGKFPIYDEREVRK